MGLIKNLAVAFKPSNIKRGIDAARHPPTQEELDAALATLTPEQRAAYDANMAQVEQGRAESAAAWTEAVGIEAQARPLWGPAGDYVYGHTLESAGSPAEIEARVAEQGLLGTVGEIRARNKGQFKDAVKQSFRISPVKQIDDPAQRAEAAAAERAARDQARASYRAGDAVPVAFTRIATRGKSQLAEVLQHLASSGPAPDRVFGVYRVPDRISQALTTHSEKGRIVEWDVVHAADAPPAPGAVPVATSFVAEEQWVARRVGEPSILDEDLALAFCFDAGVGPEQCFGVARVAEFRTLRGHGDDQSAGDIYTLVKGVVAIHPEESSGAFAAMAAAAPLGLPHGGHEWVHTEVLNWSAIAQAVHPKINHPHSVPSPFPYLPSTPEELLTAYLEVVGVKPWDCYSAQATVDHARALVDGGFMTTNIGPKQPCADGKDRMRSHGCEHVVVSYRSTPEYAAGRERWARYEAEVLQARLSNGVRVRPTVQVNDDPTQGVPTSILRAAVRAADVLDRIEEIGIEHVPPHRYCWPPVA